MSEITIYGALHGNNIEINKNGVEHQHFGAILLDHDGMGRVKESASVLPSEGAYRVLLS